MRTSPGVAYGLGYHVVWCPEYRLEELIGAQADEHGTLRSRSSFVATVGAVSAETVRRYIETQCERAPKA
ncbi:hypothetical protein ACTMTF_20280 [Nonomuraea sp. ZG12]|uniref:hypothetical protein n=1 Tax=Nonomuraea sp. ZG12 TaxID=3452207 RepID=UPI003F8C47BD